MHFSGSGPNPQSSAGCENTQVSNPPPGVHRPVVSNKLCQAASRSATMTSAGDLFPTPVPRDREALPPLTPSLTNQVTW